jgi:hypothetical protein
MSAIENTLAQRGSRYGTIEDNSELCQGMLDVLKGHDGWDQLSQTHRECLHMVLHKISRMISGDCWYDDNPHDIAGYATLLEQYIIEKVKADPQLLREND